MTSKFLQRNQTHVLNGDRTKVREEKAKETSSSSTKKKMSPQSNVMTVFLGLLAAQFVSATSNTIISNAMPVIVAQIGGNAVQYTWVITAGILANTITTPVIGKLADLFDKKKLFIASLIILATASLLSGASQSANQLIASRVLQGCSLSINHARPGMVRRNGDSCPQAAPPDSVFLSSYS